MASRLVADVEGLAELNAKLRKLDARVRGPILDKALRQSANVFRDAARKRAPLLKEPHPYRRRGVLRKSIKTKKERGGMGFRVFSAGPKGLTKRQISAYKGAGGKKARRNPKDPFYAVFVEGKPLRVRFMRRALEFSQSDALREFIKVARKAVDRIERLG